MIIKLVEYLVASAANGCHMARARRRAQIAGRQETATPPSSSHTIVGRVVGPVAGEAFDGEGRELVLSDKARRRHIYILGATGTGKSNLLLKLIESDIVQGRSFCVFDLRGDLIDRILLRSAALRPLDGWRDRLVVLDLRQEDAVVGFNPLVGPGDAYARAFHVLSVLRQQSESWGIQLEETLRNCLVALAQTGWSLLEVEPMLCDPAFRSNVLTAVQDRYVRSFFERFDKLSDEHKTAWILPVLNKVTPLVAIPRLRRMFADRRPFSLATQLDDRPGSAILVALAIDRLHQAAYLVGGLMVSAFQNAMMARVDQPEERRRPVHLYVDEFETMASDQFEAIVAEGRRFGVGLCLSHQNLTQMPPKLSQVLLNNMHTQFYFQTGASDASLLAREVAAIERKRDLIQLITHQCTGEAVFILRGQESLRVKIDLCRDPEVDKEAVAALRSLSMEQFARSSKVVDQEIAKRHQKSELVRVSNDSASTHRAESSRESAATAKNQETDYEIRHAPRRRKFGKPPDNSGQRQ